VRVCRNDACVNGPSYRGDLACTHCFCVPVDSVRKEAVVSQEDRSVTLPSVWRGEPLCASVTSGLGKIVGDYPVSVFVPVAPTGLWLSFCCVARLIMNYGHQDSNSLSKIEERVSGYILTPSFLKYRCLPLQSQQLIPEITSKLQPEYL
jgi:hypothetical protein